MPHSRSFLLSGLFVLLLGAPAFHNVHPAWWQGADAARHAAPDRLGTRVSTLASAFEGVLGVAAYHIESGRRFGFNASEPFPMASVYKLPITVAVLHQVDRGRLRLDSTITVHPSDFAPHHSPLAEEAGGRPVSRTPGHLLGAMLGYSDNTASDVLLRLVGGPDAVQERLAELGVEGVRVDRSEREMALDRTGVGALPEGEAWSRERFAELEASVPAGRRDLAHQRYLNDPRDVVAIFIKDAEAEAFSERERLIAEVARSLYTDLVEHSKNR